MSTACRTGMSVRRWALAVLALAALAHVSPGQEPPPPKAATHMVAMGDGVKLATDVYLPGDGAGRYPVIVARTPYGKGNGGPAMAANSARRGYAFVIQDLRGRFKSEG